MRDSLDDATATRLRRMLSTARLHPERWGSERELTHAIYGTIVGAAAMAAASLHDTLSTMVITVLVTVAVYWAAERYAEVLAAAVRGPGHRLSHVGRAMRRGWPTVEAAYTPLIVLIVVVLITGELDAGVFAALAVSTAMLSGLGYLAARRADGSRPSAFAWATASAALGVTVILLKTALH